MKKLYIILLFFLLIPFVPKFGSVDVIGPQWLLFSIFNLSFIIYNFFSSGNTKFIFYKSFLFKLYAFFFLLILLSVLYSVNLNLTIHDIARDINVFLLFCNFLVFVRHKSISFYYVSIVFSFILLLEVAFSLQTILKDFFKDGLEVFDYTRINLNAFLGIAGNKNIVAASIVFKLPFLFYFLYHSKKFLSIFFSFFFLIFISFNISVLSARAALLSFVFISLSFSCYLLYKKHLIKFFSFLLSISIGVYISILFIPSNDNNPITRLSTIEVSNESSSFRLELWEDAFGYSLDKIFIGSGRGSWKIESSQFWKDHGREYLVPYHAHNDFLEIGTELGWLGMLTYLSIFLFSFLFLLKNFLINKGPFSFFLFLALSVYFVDAFFNFPMERPLMQIPFAIILFIITSLELNINTLSDEY